jgi:hypothetical protein
LLTDVALELAVITLQRERLTGLIGQGVVAAGSAEAALNRLILAAHAAGAAHAALAALLVGGL